MGNLQGCCIDRGKKQIEGTKEVKVHEKRESDLENGQSLKQQDRAILDHYVKSSSQFNHSSHQQQNQTNKLKNTSSNAQSSTPKKDMTRRQHPLPGQGEVQKVQDQAASNFVSKIHSIPVSQQQADRSINSNDKLPNNLTHTEALKIKSKQLCDNEEDIKNLSLNDSNNLSKPQQNNKTQSLEYSSYDSNAFQTCKDTSRFSEKSNKLNYSNQYIDDSVIDIEDDEIVTQTPDKENYRSFSNKQNPKEKKKKKKRKNLMKNEVEENGLIFFSTIKPKGLPNISSNCYLNSLIQILTTMNCIVNANVKGEEPQILKYLKRFRGINYSYDKKPKIQSSELIRRLGNLISQYSLEEGLESTSIIGEGQDPFLILSRIFSMLNQNNDLKEIFKNTIGASVVQFFSCDNIECPSNEKVRPSVINSNLIQIKIKDNMGHQDFSTYANNSFNQETYTQPEYCDSCGKEAKIKIEEKLYPNKILILQLDKLGNRNSYHVHSQNTSFTNIQGIERGKGSYTGHATCYIKGSDKTWFYCNDTITSPETEDPEYDYKDYLYFYFEK